VKIDLDVDVDLQRLRSDPLVIENTDDADDAQAFDEDVVRRSSRHGRSRYRCVMANSTVRSTFDPARVVTSLRELASRTGGPEGSRRLCWTPEWLEARALLRESLATLPVEVDVDEAGNLWAYLRGERPDTLVVGSHLDSVPKGGWLDGALGVMAGPWPPKARRP
jgi:hypothetical protein